jgi:hypothetical protein
MAWSSVGAEQRQFLSLKRGFVLARNYMVFTYHNPIRLILLSQPFEHIGYVLFMPALRAGDEPCQSLDPRQPPKAPMMTSGPTGALQYHRIQWRFLPKSSCESPAEISDSSSRS